MDVSHSMPDPPDGGPAAVPHDAALPDARVPEDAGPVEPPPPDDAGQGEADAATTSVMGIRNGSFEITSVPPEPGSLDPITNATEITPWRWCAGNVGVNHGFDSLTASDGEWMLSLSFSVGPAEVVQKLEQPLVRGARYAFEIDAARNNEGPDDVRLELIGTNSTCTSSSVLAQTARLGQSLTTYCLSFKASEAHEHVALRMNPLGLTADVFADHLREVPSCP